MIHDVRRSHERIETTRTVTKHVKKCLTILLQQVGELAW
jgi:hypothetical protein